MIPICRRAVVARLANAPLVPVFLGLSRASLAEIALEAVSIETPSGRTISGVIGVPAAIPAPAVLLIHGSPGLSDVIKSFAHDFARDGFLALALDLFDGRTAKDETARWVLRSEANANPAKATETIAAWIAWLRADPRTNGKVGIVGWSFGAEWALRASVAIPVEATVIYVGLMWPRDSLAHLKGPVLGHFGERDEISRTFVELFEAKMQEAGKSAEIHWYAGDHFFAIPTYPSYDEKLAKVAWTRTVAFLRANLR
jgi:carboxymethylenebutenolidase